MALVRQLPQLYLRGSLVNITMAGLTPEQRALADSITEYVAEHKEMSRHRHQMMKELGDTIAADYRDDRQAADQEYRIAVWRAVVNLYFHRKYTFRCRSCGQSTYTTKRRVPKPIDRVQTPCPNCGQVEITKSGCTGLTVGSFVPHSMFQDSYRYAQTDLPECGTTIDVIKGELCYPNPDEVVNDTKQMVKFFGEFVWNYFRQQLRENSRTEHHREPQEIVGRADEVLVQEIVSLCAKLKIDCNYCSETQPEDGWYRLQVNGLQTPPEFSGEFALLMQDAHRFGLHVEIGPTTISIRENPTAETTSALVVKPEHVMVLDNSISVSDESDDGAFTINQISFRTVGAQRMDPEDHVRAIERADVARAVKAALPDGDCRRIWEILLQNGDTYEQFRGQFDYDGMPRQQHMAAFLNITPRAVKNHVADIRRHCLANGFSPANLD